MAGRHYTSGDEDSARWAAIRLRDGDVLVSTRSKHGTTWVQAILLTMVHGPDLPAPLGVLSPWVDHLVEPVEDLAARLEAQDHRRVLKTHTPLDGLPDDPRVHRVVVARHPLDAAVSLYHQGTNIDRDRLATLTGGSPTTGPQVPPDAWLADWIRAERDPTTSLDSLQGVLWHLADAWSRRDDPGVHLVHYADLASDPGHEVRRLAAALDLAPDTDVDTVVAATGFDAMRDRAHDLVPDTSGVLRDRAGFFRGGRRGDGASLASAEDLAVYRARVDELVDPELAAWLHR